MSYKTLLVELEDGVLTVTLNRPEVHNAFNDELIVEAIDLFSNIDVDAARIVVLKGTGKNFCAGADLNWMSRMVSYTRDENVRDSSLLAKMYALIDQCSAARRRTHSGRGHRRRGRARVRVRRGHRADGDRSSGCPR